MRVAAVRRTVLAASAVTLALMVAACGGGDGGGDSKAEALTAAELERAVVTSADVKGHEVKKPGEDDFFAPGSVEAGKAECQPVALAMSALPVGKPAASVQREINEPHASDTRGPSMKDLAEMTEGEAKQAMLDSIDVTMTRSSLWSYDGAGARQALAALRGAGRKCANGFSVTIDGYEEQVTKVAEGESGAGEEAVALTVTSESKDGPVETKVVVFREGATLAGFSSYNMASVVRGESLEAPTALIEAQETKLG
jgi:hypothetical protein